MTDEALLAAWNDGDERAGEQLFDRHFVPIVRFFRSKVNGEIEELVQETFLRCVEAKRRFRGEGGFAGFLFGIARHVLLGHYRKQRRTGEVVEIGEVSLHALDPRPSAVLTETREQQVLLESLRRLPLESQIILELHYWENLTSAAIATVLQVPHGTAQTRIRRARQLLAAEVARWLGPAAPQNLDFEAWARSLRDRVDHSARS